MEVRLTAINAAVGARFAATPKPVRHAWSGKSSAVELAGPAIQQIAQPAQPTQILASLACLDIMFLKLPRVRPVTVSHARMDALNATLWARSALNVCQTITNIMTAAEHSPDIARF